MPFTISEKRELYIKIFIQEFIREFQFLSDVVAGRSTRKGDFTDKLLSVMNIVAGMVSDVSSVAATVLSTAVTVGSWVHEGNRAKAIGNIGNLNDLIDQHKLQIVVEIVAREAARRYEYFMETRLTDKPFEGVIPFAKCGVERVLEYLARTGKAITEENLLQGLIEGRSGAYVTNWFNTRLPGKNRYERKRLTAEGVYARSAFRTPDDEKWVRHTALHKENRLQSRANFSESLFNYGYVKFADSQKTEPKYGYVLVPQAIVRQYDYQKQTVISRALAQELQAHPMHTIHVTARDVATYLQQLQEINPVKRFIDYIAQQKPGVELVVCSENLSALCLQGGDFSDVDFSGALIKGNLNGISFEGAYLIGAVFEDVFVEDATFYRTHCEYLTISGSAQFRKVNFAQCFFNYADLSNSSFSECCTTGTVWYGAELQDVQNDFNASSTQQQQMHAMQAAIADQQQQLLDLDSQMAEQKDQLQSWSARLQSVIENMSAQAETQEQVNLLKDQVNILMQSQASRFTFERHCQRELEILQAHTVDPKTVREAERFLSEVRSIQQILQSRLTVTVTQFDQCFTSIQREYPGLKLLCQDLRKTLGAMQEDLSIANEISQQRLTVLQEKLDTLETQLVGRIERLEQRQLELGGEIQGIRNEQAAVGFRVGFLEEVVSNSLNPARTVLVKLQALRQRTLENEDIKQVLAIYIPVRAAPNAQAQENFDMEGAARQFFASNKKVLLLLGNSGGGKSTFNLFFHQKLWADFQEGDPIPLFISLPTIQDSELHLLEEYLHSEGFNEGEIEYLKQHHSFRLILDGYDERDQKKNFYASNGFERLQVQILISCRTQYLNGVANYQKLFIPAALGNPRADLLSEMTVVPFSAEQITAYIKKYIEISSEAEWTNSEIYEQHINNLPGLRTLIETPFLLMITMDVLPRIIKKYSTIEESQRVELTQADLYDEFVQKWFERQEDKLFLRGQAPDDGHDVKEDFWEFAKHLAGAMYKAGVNQVTYLPRSRLFGVQRQDPWERFFTTENKDMFNARVACPLTKIGNGRWAFMHLTLFDYFLTKGMYEDILEDRIVPASVPAPVVQVYPSTPMLTAHATVATSAPALSNPTLVLHQPDLVSMSTSVASNRDTIFGNIADASKSTDTNNTNVNLTEASGTSLFNGVNEHSSLLPHNDKRHCCKAWKCNIL